MFKTLCWPYSPSVIVKISRRFVSSFTLYLRPAAYTQLPAVFCGCCDGKTLRLLLDKLGWKSNILKLVCISCCCFKGELAEEIHKLFEIKDNLFRLPWNLGKVHQEKCILKLICQTTRKSLKGKTNWNVLSNQIQELKVAQNCIFNNFFIDYLNFICEWMKSVEFKLDF